MDNTDLLRMSQLLGADAVLAKPFGPEELRKKVQHTLAIEAIPGDESAGT